MTDDQSKAIDLIFEKVEEAHSQIAELFDQQDVNALVGAIALSTLLHQVRDELEEDEYAFVEEMTSCCVKATNVSKDLYIVDKGVMH